MPEINFVDRLIREFYGKRSNFRRIDFGGDKFLEFGLSVVFERRNVTEYVNFEREGYSSGTAERNWQTDIVVVGQFHVENNT